MLQVCPIDKTRMLAQRERRIQYYALYVCFESQRYVADLE